MFLNEAMDYMNIAHLKKRKKKNLNNLKDKERIRTGTIGAAAEREN